MILISVIVPVYNTGKYLSKCLDSIISQTFSDFELLLVDDGSSDNSGKICDEYAEKDDRISVFHKENRGVSSARNLGLDKANGKWICFIDSDDYVKPAYLQYLIENENENVDIIVGGWQPVFEGKLEKSVQFRKKEYSGAEFKNVFKEMNVAGYAQPWSRLYRGQIIKENNMTFDHNLSLSEDRIFFYQFLLYSKGIAFVPSSDYFYRRQMTGLANKKYSYENEVYRFKIINSYAEKIKSNFNLSDLEYIPFFIYHIGFIIRICNTCQGRLFKKLSFYSDIYDSFYSKKYDSILQKEFSLFHIYKLLGMKKILFSKRQFLLLLILSEIKKNFNSVKDIIHKI